MVAQAEAVRFLRDMRSSPWPLLYNVPPERADDVRAQLDRWVEDGGMVINGIAAGVVMSYLPPEAAESQAKCQEAISLFDAALRLNPDDANARFLRRFYIGNWANMLAEWCYWQGRTSQFYAPVQPFASIGPPQTVAEAEAQYLYGLISSRRAGTTSAVDRP